MVCLTLKKKIYFVQVGFDFDGSVYLPYGTATMAAYCSSQEDISAEYEFSGYVFRREKLEMVLERLTDPYLIAFSCSVWNMEFNKALAARVKALYPDCIIAFGGHSVRENSTEMLDEIRDVDILIFGEGEKTFAEMLRGLSAGCIDNVPNIAFRKNGANVCTQREFFDDLSDLPSPYLSGAFDAILADEPETDFLVVIETTRGCPYSCAYCDWCAGKKMRRFPLEKVMGEIRWFAEHKIEYTFCADSNFGIFERDVDIAKALVQSKRECGYPKVFRPSYEKNSVDRVFEICRILNSEGMDKGATMAYQSLSPEALKKIGRQNLTLEHFSVLQKKYNEAGIPTYSELILGLPGETLESFMRGICKLLENGQHNSISVYHCEMLPNSDMSDPDYIKKHGIETVKVPFNHIHSSINRDEEIQEYSYLVRSTNTLSREDWVNANLFSICVQCFHSLGALRCFSMYLYSEGIRSYYDFFTELLAFIMASNGKLGRLWRTFMEKYDHSLSGNWNYHRDVFGNVTWVFEEGAFLEVINDLDGCIDELTPFLRQFHFEDNLYTDLMRYQYALLRKPFDQAARFNFDYDWYTYFEKIIDRDYAPLEKKYITIEIKPNRQFNDIADYAREIVWYGRRRGATVYRGNEIRLVVEP